MKGVGKPSRSAEPRVTHRRKGESVQDEGGKGSNEGTSAAKTETTQARASQARRRNEQSTSTERVALSLFSAFDSSFNRPLRSKSV